MGHTITARATTLAAILTIMAGAGGCANTRATSPPGPEAMMPPPSLDADPGYEPAADTAPAPARTTDDLAGEMADDAPARYVVQPGDTLWDIAGYYLDSPWYWPQLWHANPGIDDPDRIYPGDVLVLSRAMDGTPRVTRARRVVRLSPRVRTEPLSEAVPTIPAGAIRAFLGSPRRVDEATLSAAPYVVSVGEAQLVAGTGAPLYIRDLPADGPDRYALVRPGETYLAPDSQTILGREAVPIGEVVIEARAAETDDSAEVATARLANAQREARPGDRLLPIVGGELVRDFKPRTPARPVSAPIVSAYERISQIGQYDVVALAGDDAATLSRGDVLDVYQDGRVVVDPIAGDPVRLPEMRVGRLMVFDRQGAISYALIMSAERPMHVGDLARSPVGHER